VFKYGDKVVVLEAHVNGMELPGEIVRPFDEDEAKGRYVVLMCEGNRMYVEPERIITVDEYAKLCQENSERTIYGRKMFKL
jgi:hypothetical protein